MPLSDKFTSRDGWPAVRALLVRRRWWLLLPLLAGWLGVVSLHWLLPSNYESQALLLVEQQSVPQSYVQSNVTFNAAQLLQSMGLQVLSRDRLAQVVRQYHLYPAVQQEKGMDAAIQKLQKQITIEPVSLTSLPNPPPGDWSAIRIAFDAPTPELAQAVDNDLTTSFIQENLRATQQASAQTTTFLQQQLQQAAAQLQQAQAQVQSYERGHMGTLPGQEQANLALLMNQQSALAASLATRDRMKLEIAADQALLAHAPTPEQAQMQQDLASLQSQLQAMRSHYTDRYPGVATLQQHIAALQSQLQAGSAPHTTEAADGASGTLELSQVRSRMEADQALLPQLQQQVTGLQKQVQRYQQRLALAPLPAAQLAGLQAQEQQAETSYQALLTKLNDSQMASQLEAQQGGAQFSLVNAPELPRMPMGPDPAVLGLLGLGLGLVLGLGASAAAELMQDRIGGEADVMTLGLTPVLARIPALRSTAEWARQRRRAGWEWAAAVALVMALIAGNLWLLRLAG